MTTYRLYVIPMNGERRPPSDVQCINHVAAMDVARTYLRQGVTVEVWTGQELVGELRVNKR